MDPWTLAPQHELMSAEVQSGNPVSGNRRGSPVMRVARLVNLVLTWGLPDGLRRDQLAEAEADWEAMEADLGPTRVALRTLRGVPAWLWMRLTMRNTTTLPAATAAGFVAMGAVTAVLQPAAYPVKMRFFIGMAAAGLILSSVMLLRRPHRLAMRSLGVSSFAAAVGMIGIASDLPEVDQWTYATPVLENRLINASTEYGLLLVGIGFAVMALNAWTTRRTLALAGGGTIIVGLVVFAGGQIVWGAWAATVDPWLSASSIIMGLAALSCVHVMPRLRHLLVE